jgi:hypothetical protein
MDSILKCIVSSACALLLVHLIMPRALDRRYPRPKAGDACLYQRAPRSLGKAERWKKSRPPELIIGWRSDDAVHHHD